MNDPNERTVFDTLQAQRRIEEILAGRSRKATAKILSAILGQWLATIPESEQADELGMLFGVTRDVAHIETAVRQSNRGGES